MPKRIQMTRAKGGWRKDNPDAVIVARPSKWGNPFPIEGTGPLDRFSPDAAGAVGHFTAMLSDPEMIEAAGYPVDLSELGGRDLACWCPLGQPCHADVLIEAANDTDERSG